ncbi:MAG: OmpA family protein [Flavobacteriaceae bacterium]
MKNKSLLITLLLFSISFFSQESERLIEITNLDVNSGYADFGVTFYKNDMVLFISSRKEDNVKLSERTRNRMQHLFFFKGLIGDDGQIIFAGRYSLEKFNMFYESDISFMPDGKTIFFTLNNYIDDEYADEFKKSSKKTHILNIFKATIDDAGIATNITPVPINNSDYSVHNPRVSPDGKTLYYVSNSDQGFGEEDIYKIALHEDGSYGPPKNLGPTINTKGREVFPFLSSNNVLYFSSDGHGGKGYLDIFSSKYENGIYNDVKNIDGNINSEYDDIAFVISPEKGIGYFSSTRKGQGGADIFGFKIKQVECNQLVAGVLKNKLDDTIISDATVQLLSNGKEVQTVQTDENGIYVFEIDCEKQYLIKVQKDAFTNAEKNFITSNVNDFQESHDLFIQPLDCKQSITGTVLSEETLIPLVNIELALYYKNTLLERTYSQIGGLFQFEVEVECNANYEIKAEGINYLPTFIDITTDDITSGIVNAKINMKEFQDFITVRNVTMIQTDPIHFDLNDFSIRRDAAIELNKVVEMMNNHPEIKIEVGSHTDSRAPDAYNMRLSEDRASSTMAYIISKGIDPNRIIGKGYGETQLVNKCTNGVKCSEAEHQANRRTEFVVINE